MTYIVTFADVIVYAGQDRDAAYAAADKIGVVHTWDKGKPFARTVWDMNGKEILINCT